MPLTLSLAADECPDAPPLKCGEVSPDEMKSLLKRGERVLGIDPGKKRVGLAISDVSLLLASPAALIDPGRMKAVREAIEHYRKTENIGALVVGMPLELDGHRGSSARRAHDWGCDLAKGLDLPVGFQDERLSTSAVNKFLIDDLDMTRKRRKRVVDKLSAAYLLQIWLERMR